MAEQAAVVAREQVARVRDDPDGRLELTARTYREPLGPVRRHRPFRRAALSFMRWQRRRGVLAPTGGAQPGSAWWRACNERLLRDGCEAVALRRGAGGPASSHSVALWSSFLDGPSPSTWYRAHNASIVSAYLEHRDLAEAEGEVERFFLNVVLYRVLYAHALAAAPRLALSWLAPAGRVLGDPRLGAVGMFLSLQRVVPQRYPPDRELDDYLRIEHRLGEVFDHAVAFPRLPRLYAWSARELQEPGLLDLLDGGLPCYAWSNERTDVWGSALSRRRTVRAIRRILPAP